ncbi:MAG TPA: STAS/SEC14 domain-containing protein [Candidatus Cybelea sp.]|nr:STAS/SEC14 domain-containing protein [Candidatus Cybelea sp.]
MEAAEHDGPAMAPSPVGEGARVFARGDHRAGVRLEIADGPLLVTVEGDPPGSYFVDCFREAFGAGAIPGNTGTVVDLTGFNGRVDWSAIRAIGGFAPRSDDPHHRPRVAYVTESAWFNAILKLISVLYPKSTHRRFDDVESAIAWLSKGE